MQRFCLRFYIYVQLRHSLYLFLYEFLYEFDPFYIYLEIFLIFEKSYKLLLTKPEMNYNLK